MCDPVLVGAGLQAAGSIQKAQAQSAAANANATIQEHNATIADMAAGDAVSRGSLVAGRALMTGAAVQGKQQAGFASSGVDTQTGTAAVVQGDTGGLSMLDALTAENNAARTAWGYRAQAANFRYQSRIGRAAGQDASDASILGGASSVAPYLKGLKIGGGADNEVPTDYFGAG